MKQNTLLPTVVVGLFLVTNRMLPISIPAAEATPKPAPVYSVGEYNPERDPARDLAMTIQRAGKESRRILIQVGGEWCGWCHRMNDYFHQNTKVAAALQDGFIIMKVNFSQENKNEGFLKQCPTISGCPHLFVLESDGRLLHPQSTGELEEGKGCSETAVLKFLAKWVPDRTPDGSGK